MRRVDWMLELNDVVGSRGSGISKDAIMGVIKCYKRTTRVKTH